MHLQLRDSLITHQMCCTFIRTRLMSADGNTYAD